MMKRGFFVFLAALLILNVLAVAVIADQGNDSSSNVSASASADVSSGSDSGNASVNSGVREDAFRLGQKMRNATMQFREDRRQLLNDSQKIMDERRALLNDTKQLREDIKDMFEQRKEMMQAFEEKLKEQKGEWKDGNRTIMISQLNDSQKEIIAAKINARTGLNITAADISNGTAGQELRAWLSNGRFADVKVMPDTASKVALERLQARCDSANCSVELKEVGSGNNTRAAYEVKTEKTSRLLFLFPMKMAVQAQVDSQTGQIVSVSKPWWAFLAKEDNANETEIRDSVGTSTDANVSVNNSTELTTNSTIVTNVSANMTA